MKVSSHADLQVMSGSRLRSFENVLISLTRMKPAIDPLRKVTRKPQTQTCADLFRGGLTSPCPWRVCLTSSR